MVFDDRICALGEGPLWHPERQSLFWFDILGKRLYLRDGNAVRTWDFDRMVSAAGWVDDKRLFIASETNLFLFDTETAAESELARLEQDNPGTRSNDGRADPWGGFWIGTMGKFGEEAAGAIYRYYKGEVRQLYPGITIPNAISFSPDGTCAYYTDTKTRIVMRQDLSEPDGWPKGDPEPWIDLAADGLNPDGAVVDAQGNFWNAHWGAARVACYDPRGHFQYAVEIGADQASCPAFGGPDLTTLYCTSAAVDIPDAWRAENPDHGKTFVVEDVAKGQSEHKVIL